VCAVVLSTTYLGSITWWAAVVQHKEIYLEKQENFVKQSYRNRCYIDGPNGLLMLNIPVKHKADKSITKVKVAYQENWHQKHWQALQTTYQNSPFFETIAPGLQNLYAQKHTFLWELNQAFISEIKGWLRLKTTFYHTKAWQAKTKNTLDWRQTIHPKVKPGLVADFPTYHQMFDYRDGFKANLSIIDLLFNEGWAAYDYLAQLEFVNSATT
jgi:hypothetical protein